jgi:ABC-type transporter Mla subunit MlaD
MVGAVTTLIVIVAVFLAYNANNGLPFVPVYRVSAETCNAARLAPNNEVRIGGNRVGVVESIETVELEDAAGCPTADGSSAAVAAQINRKLDETA